MRCLFCRYPLEGLSSNRCPECGREFDPHDPATFDPTAAPSVLGSHVFWRWALVLTTVPPLGNTAIAALCWFVAAATLGHPPRPGVDDPTYIRSIAWLAPLWQMTGACACTSVLAALPPIGVLFRLGGSESQRQTSRRMAIGA